ncbi:hypothetical protein [Stutzerimonas nitrititolerans]|uniref:hypothetical protein n=1 Tax=Stutzerimonas nitrititolerans TaxID=2482751 RepID=UPI00289FDC8F|nr:hypothetical protein [Stutzerimonas nitrititolerans]
MSRHSYKIILKALNASARHGYSSLLSKVDSLRRKSGPSFYPEITLGILEAAQKIPGRHAWTGYNDVKYVGYRSNLVTSLGIEEDLTFCAAWLTHHVDNINQFITSIHAIEASIFAQEYENAKNKVDSLIDSHGWSVTLLELSFFLEEKISGIDGVKALNLSIKAQGKQRIVSVLAEIFSERVDENYSIDAFLSKWSDSFNRYFSTRPQIKSYVAFRGTNQIDVLEIGLGHSLCADFSNSIYDCYNTLIEAMASLVTERNSAKHGKLVSSIASQLISAGIKDRRLPKITAFCGEHQEPKITVSHDPLDSITDALLLEQAEPNSRYLAVPALNKLFEQGASAQSELLHIVRLGLCLRTLPVGAALLNYGFKVTSSDLHDKTALPWVCLARTQFRLEELFCLDDDRAWESIRALAENQRLPAELNAQAVNMLAIKDNKWNSNSHSQLSNTAMFWLARGLAQDGRYQEAVDIASALERSCAQGTFQAKRLYVYIYCLQGDLATALNMTAIEVTSPESRAYTLPLGELFAGKKWLHFRDHRLVDVAVAAHYTYSTFTRPDKNIKHTCAMACRAIYQCGGRDWIQSNWQEAGLADQRKYTYLLDHIWLEENFGLIDDLKSTADVRLERIAALELLVQLNPTQAQAYGAKILEVTLLDTVLTGLSHVDESRIFVNEPSIARWADKELRHDVERWKKQAAPKDIEDLEHQRDLLIKLANEPDSQEFQEFASTSLSERNKLLLSIVERLKDRFLNDPIDGLNCYLSSRIRHGTFRGTILGPMEESGFLVSGTDVDQKLLVLFDSYTEETLENIVIPALRELTHNIAALVDDATKNKIRILSDSHPQGYIKIIQNDILYGNLYSLLGSEYEFQVFISLCFGFFWELLTPSLRSLHDYFSGDFQQKLQSNFEVTIQKISSDLLASRQATDALRKVAAQTGQQCEIAARWFYTEDKAGERFFSLKEALGIAEKATKNTYRLFNAQVHVSETDCLALPLTSIGLATIVECIHITFENCWKHSGLGSAQYDIQVSVEQNIELSSLEMTVSNPLSSKRLVELDDSEIQKIRDRFNYGLDPSTVAGEGGSGLPKLARLSIDKDQGAYSTSLKISIKESLFQVSVSIPLHKRGEAYDAYN